MSDRFLKNMKHMLENTRGLSLKILLEEKEEKKDKEDPFADAFGSDDEDDKKEDKEGDSEEDEELGIGDEEDEEEPEEEPQEDVYDDLHSLKDFTDTVADANDEKERVKNKFKFTPQSVIESVSRNISLNIRSLMLLKEENEEDRNLEKTLDKVEKSLEDEQERIEKLGDDAHSLSAKIKKGHRVNFEKEASEALSNFKNFDAKFSKAEIIANMYIDKISELSSPQDLERNIKDFLTKFNQLLPSTDKIDIQEKPVSYNTGTGGKTPSG